MFTKITDSKSTEQGNTGVVILQGDSYAEVRQNPLTSWHLSRQEKEPDPDQLTQRGASSNPTVMRDSLPWLESMASLHGGQFALKEVPKP